MVLLLLWVTTASAAAPLILRGYKLQEDEATQGSLQTMILAVTLLLQSWNPASPAAATCGSMFSSEKMGRLDFMIF